MLPKLTHPPQRLGALAAYPYSRRLEEDLTFVTKYDEVVVLGEREGNVLWVPREMAPLGGQDLRSPGTPVELVCNLPPKNAQQQTILAQSWSLLEQGRSHIIQAGTGTGKTYMALNLAARLGVTTLIVVTKSVMMEQWKQEIQRFLGLPPEAVGTIRQNVCDVAGKPVVVGMLHSLAKDKYPDWINDYFGLVIFDETHRLGADFFVQAAKRFSARLRLGLSATPKRADGKTFVFLAHIGPVGVVADSTLLAPKVLTVTSNYTLPLVNRKENGRIVNRPLPLNPGRTTHISKRLGKMYSRNRKIVSFVSQAYAKGRHTVVFSDLIDGHLMILRPMLVAAGIPAEDIGIFSPSVTKKKDELEASKHKRVVLTTYTMCSEAVDVPRWDTAVLAIPVSNIKQAVGRILREHPDKAQPLVLDVVDHLVPLFQVYAKKRREQYAALGATVVEM